MRLLPASARTHPTRAARARQEKTTRETEAEFMNRTKTANRARASAGTYFALVKRHPLTSIRNEQELAAAQAVIDALLREDLDGGKLAYLDALSDLVIVYEQEHYAVARLPPHELLGEMLEERGMSQADLGRATGLAKATVSELVTGKRHFTVNQMQSVAKVFGLPGTVFMPKTTNA